MGFRSGLWSKLGLDAFKAEQAQLLAKWEYDQTNDWDLLDADPFKDALLAAADLIEEAPEESFARMLGFAQAGSLYGMNSVAWCYAVGTGVTKDWDQAQTWHRRAYEGGSASSQRCSGSSASICGRHSP